MLASAESRHNGREFAPGLHHVAGRAPEDIGGDSVVAVLVARNEGWRLPFWLNYHRWLGIDHFIVVDNRSVDRTGALLRQQDDVSLIEVPGAFSHQFWKKAIVERAPASRWHLILDADELFVAAPWRKGGLKDTIEALQSQDADVASALMVDCYPAKFPMKTGNTSAVPWVRAPWFDAGPYGRWSHRRRKFRLSYNGVRERLLWPYWKYHRHLPKLLRKMLKIDAPPFIVKVPLIKPSAARDFNIHRSASRNRPESLFNILHFKFDIDFNNKVLNAIDERQYHNASAEYDRYARLFSGRTMPIKISASRRFTGLSSLMEAKLCRYDQHFLASVKASGPIDVGAKAALEEIAGYCDTLNVEDIGGLQSRPTTGGNGN